MSWKGSDTLRVAVLQTAGSGPCMVSWGRLWGEALRSVGADVGTLSETRIFFAEQHTRAGFGERLMESCDAGGAQTEKIMISLCSERPQTETVLSVCLSANAAHPDPSDSTKGTLRIQPSPSRPVIANRSSLEFNQGARASATFLRNEQQAAQLIQNSTKPK